MGATRQLCTFTLAGHHFGVDVRNVQEVLRHQPMTAVALAPPEVRGLINLRGQIVTAIDLRRRLALPDRTAGQPPMNVIVRTEDGVASFLVDEIGDVVDVAPDRFELPPATLTGAVRDLIEGVYKLDRHLVLVLEVDRAADVTAASTRIRD